MRWLRIVIGITATLLPAVAATARQATQPAQPRPKLGLYLQAQRTGVQIADVVPHLPADVAGIRAGDQIIRISDDVIDSPAALREAIEKLEIGQSARIKVVRDGEVVELELKLDPPPAGVSIPPEFRQPTHPQLRAELLKMRDRDQALRSRINPDLSPQQMRAVVEEMSAVDRDNTARLKDIIAEHGFPTISMAGSDGANAAWLLVQHADADPDFQSEILPKLQELALAKEASKRNVAYLTDRVLRAQNKPQLYATQYFQEEGADGKKQYVPPIVDDPAHLDQRRAEMGLGPWAEYEAMMAKMQNREPFKSVRAPE